MFHYFDGRKVSSTAQTAVNRLKRQSSKTIRSIYG
jgi:hypothetical protein